jgi:hypothetical protein
VYAGLLWLPVCICCYCRLSTGSCYAAMLSLLCEHTMRLQERVRSLVEQLYAVCMQEQCCWCYCWLAGSQLIAALKRHCCCPQQLYCDGSCMFCNQ